MLAAQPSYIRPNGVLDQNSNLHRNISLQLENPFRKRIMRLVQTYSGDHLIVREQQRSLARYTNPLVLWVRKRLL